MTQLPLEVYRIDMEYIRNLHNIDDSIFSVSPQIGKDERPFIKFVMNLLHPSTSAYFYQDTINPSAYILPEHNVRCYYSRLGAAHSNNSGRYSEFCFARIAPHS